MHPSFRTVAASALILACTPASAQMFNGFAGQQAMNRTIMANVNQRGQLNAHAEERARNQSVDVTTIPTAESLSFRASPQRRKVNFKTMVDRLRSSDPASAAQLETILSSGDLISQLDAAMRPMGLRSNNVADAYTVWWIAAWEAVNSRDVGNDRDLYQAVKAQAAAALMATPQYSSASEAQKQEMAESLLIQAAVVSSAKGEVAGNRAQQAALAKAVNQGAKSMGFDLTTMNLTPNGFVLGGASRSDASDPAADSTQLAANDEGGGNLALYAVAGTGLLAGVFALGKGLSKKG